ncbi:hypothetical protein tinsulaeT_06780 [Thalassotalea insulae]|uniref:TonB C-terminal domain-containing protein n=1 Tax=Thalassotalea insulae TaxID=2056778 RepID=A0ABQ6GMX2_9GAMM|nr:energy transducer TonB [Thalassotalea insulae]GLX77338.1 hypothetical protein tinsulaeT_06780 [Thalassotalea insulae]
MQRLSFLLFISLITVGCSSNNKELLSEIAINVKMHELHKYWVPKKSSISFNNNWVPPQESGFVNVKILIGSNGEVSNPVIIESKGGWDKFALRAVQEKHYVNTDFNHKKTPVYVILEFRFSAPSIL